MSTDAIVPARPASAVVLARESMAGGFEVFMVRRHIKSDFVPDVFVFPGGSVTDDDRAVEQLADLCGPGVDGPTRLGMGFRAAAIRECFEEAGVLLARRGNEMLGVSEDVADRYLAYRTALYQHELTLADIMRREQLTLATDSLVHWAHWITPEALPKRFDTHFFLAHMPEAQEPTHDRIETTESMWIRPADALAEHERDNFPIVFATLHQLRALAEMNDLMSVATHLVAPPPTIMPRVVARNGRDVILLPDEE